MTLRLIGEIVVEWFVSIVQVYLELQFRFPKNNINKAIKKKKLCFLLHVK